jgi:copper homeostasis protein
VPDGRNGKLRMLLEVIVQSVSDAREAERGGADRLEVVRNLEAGGLTPPHDLVRDIAAEVSLPLRVMVRENDGYSTHPGERTALADAAARFADLGVDGVVIGFARDGQLQIEQVIEVVPAAVKVTFHRAFDQLAAPCGAIVRLSTLAQIDRILTSGGEGSAVERCERLHEYQELAGSRLTIIAGGGVDEEVLRLLAQRQVMREVHVGRAAREGQRLDGAVSAASVRRLRSLLDTAN